MVALIKCIRVFCLMCKCTSQRKSLMNSFLPWNCIDWSGEKDGQDEGYCTNLVLQSKERPTKHDVSEVQNR